VARADDPQRISQLTAGIERLSLAALSNATVPQMMQIFMQVIGEALHLRRVLICLRMRGPDRLEGRMGSNAEAQRIAPVFTIPLQPPSDLFGLLCQKGSDSLISDTSDPLIAERLPAWFREQVRATAFLVLPVLRAGQVVGMVYADSPPSGQMLHVTERELALIKSLRNQVLMALQLREGAAAPKP
jgi:GAF domain-containing protein